MTQYCGKDYCRIKTTILTTNVIQLISIVNIIDWIRKNNEKLSIL